MKKLKVLLISLICFSSSLTSCGQAPLEVDFTILTDQTMEGNFYPSLAIWNSVQEDPSDLFYSFYLNAPKAGSVIRITIEETALNEKTVIQEVATEPGEMEIFPIIKWNYDKLSKLSQGGVVTMTCILEIDGKEIDRINNVVKYRPINECVFAMYDSSEEEWVDLSEMFALYVNEDYPEIDVILKEILALDRDRQFLDYQGDAQDFLNQVVWVWEYFANKGTRYSNVVSTSNESELLGVQYVRFIDQALNNVQANCVDGSVLLASVYRKIGLDAYLVFVPGHCMLAIGYPGEMNMGEYGATYGEDGGVLLIETTLMGANTDHITSFNSAIELFTMAEFERRVYEEDYVVINVGAARQENIMPITRTMRKPAN
ncbi:MAG: hypothetical protein R3Y61_02190 [Rikenellaceae bacterium]